MDRWFPNTRYYIQPLFDTIQTHAVYGVPKEELPNVKRILKEKGCSKFRVVHATAKDLRIVCFYYKEK